MHRVFRNLVACATVTMAILIAASTATAAVIPYGLQSGVNQATLDSWGWTEIHRSAGNSSQSEAAIVAAATGEYLMMGVYNPATQLYEILGAGETSAVTAITYANHYGDDNFNFNPNWSNGLNFYRTSTYGSWGFTTIGRTGLYSADTLLRDGLNDYTAGYAPNNKEDATTGLAKGLSFHTNEGNLTAGWGFNVTGNNWQAIEADRQRVFFTANAGSPVPEPTTLAIWGTLSGLCLIAARRRRK